MKQVVAVAIALAGLSGCVQTPVYKSNFVEPRAVNVQPDGPVNAAPGTCWGRDETAAEIETVTLTVQENPAVLDDDGNVVTPATYKSETFQRIVEQRDAIWFETPCADQINPEFVTALQRTLTTRGYYQMDATGVMDQHTAQAIRAFQKPLGLNSGQLSLIAARKLGLVAYDRSDIETF